MNVASRFLLETTSAFIAALRPRRSKIHCVQFVEDGCGGALYGESELTIVFHDGAEERFVQALVCVGCGVVKLAIDYDTDVED